MKMALEHWRGVFFQTYCYEVWNRYVRKYAGHNNMTLNEAWSAPLGDMDVDLFNEALAEVWEERGT